jgi:hypothetical protein
VDRLLPLVGGGHAEHLVVLGLEEAQSGTLVREHVVQESIGAETHVVGVVQHDPMGGHRAQELREERGARQACNWTFCELGWGMEWIVYLRRYYWGSGPSAAWSTRAGGPPPTATTCSCGGGAGVSDRKEAGVPKQEWPTPNLKTSFNFFVHTF